MGNAREVQRSNEVSLGQPSLEPPALPPRPENPDNTALADHGNSGARNCSPCSRKYVLLCAACGGLAVILGSLFAVLYFVLRSYTSSLHYFETVPSYVASVVLIVTGLLMLCFGWRRNRFGYLVKLCGACCLVCAVVCVVITVTTTVVHMNRLQTLRECIYNARGKSCTCFTGPTHHFSSQQQAPTPSLLEFTHDEGGARYIFADTPDCEVVHGALYACLRALFGLSVIGILVSLFSGMLVYQLLGHERKKMYWEQLELRSRAHFRRHAPPPCCGCCQDCRFAPRTGNTIMSWPPWDVLDDSRYWSLHAGNLYSPGPCANGGLAAAGTGTSQCIRQQSHVSTPSNPCPTHRRNPAWNWLPWRPSSSDNGADGMNRSRIESENGPVIIGPDDHYGFPLSGNGNYRSPLAVSAAASPPIGPSYPATTAADNVLSWGPPPPYSTASTSETGSVSATTLLCLSPAGSPDPVGGAMKLSPTCSDEKENPSRQDKRPPFPHNEVPLVRGSHRSNMDPRRMPWSSHTSGLGANGLTANPSKTYQSSESPPGGSKNVTGKGDRESELYFADTSSYTISVHNDGSAESAMYEEIPGHRYDTIQHPVNKSSSTAEADKNAQSSQRFSWDGQNQSRPVVHRGQPRSRHSADAVPKEKIFSPIVIPKFVNYSGQQPLQWVSNMPKTDLSSFVPYRRAAILPKDNSFQSTCLEGEVYENVTNLDFDDQKQRTLSPDEEVAILTSQFRETDSQLEADLDISAMDCDSEDSDSVIRAVNV